MPLQTDIIAEAGAPSGWSPLASLAKGADFAAQQQKQREAQAAKQREAMINSVVQQFPDDPDGAITFLKAKDWQAAATLEKIVNEQRKSLADRRKVELDNERAEAEQFSRIIGDGSETAWRNAAAYVAQKSPGMAKFFEQPYSPELAQQVRTFGMTAQQRYDAEQKALESKRLEDWAGFVDSDPVEAEKAARFLLGPDKWLTLKGQAEQRAETARANKAQEARLAQPPPAQPFTLSPGQTRFNPDGTPVARVAPAATAGGTGSGASSAMVKSILKNPNLFNSLTPTLKEKLIVPLTEAGFDFAQNASGDGKPSNGMEKRALNFFNRAKQASEDLEKIEDGVARSGVIAQTYREWAPNFMQTGRGQQYTQAQRAFTEARLRKDSGAAIPENEFANDRKTYFVQAGDSPATVEQKRRARNALLASLGFESGRALREFYDDEATGLIEEYKAKARGGTAAPKAGGGAAPTGRFNPATGKVEPVQ